MGNRTCSLLGKTRSNCLAMDSRTCARAATMDADRANNRYLPGHPFPPNLHLTHNLNEAIAG